MIRAATLLLVLAMPASASNETMIAEQCPDGCAILTPRALAALAAEVAAMQAEIVRLRALKPVNCL